MKWCDQPKGLTEKEMLKLQRYHYLRRNFLDAGESDALCLIFLKDDDRMTVFHSLQQASVPRRLAGQLLVRSELIMDRRLSATQATILMIFGDSSVATVLWGPLPARISVVRIMSIVGDQ